MWGWTTFALHEGMVLRAEGNPTAAIETLEHVLSRQEELGVTNLIIKLSFVELLESAFELGDTGRLEQALAAIDSLRPGERPPLLSAHADRFHARLSTNPAEIESRFARAAESFVELGMSFWLAVTQLEHGEWLAHQGRGSEAAALLADARDTFERLEARPWLERLSASDAPQLVEAPV